jgi:hypothetical protein
MYSMEGVQVLQFGAATTRRTTGAGSSIGFPTADNFFQTSPDSGGFASMWAF